MKRLLFMTGFLVLSACGGWQTLYGTGHDETTLVQLGQIRVEPVYSVLGQELYGSLQDELQKFPRQAEKYRLDFTVGHRDRVLAIGADGSPSQVLRYYTSEYRLKIGSKSKEFSTMVSFTLPQDSSPYAVATDHQEVDREAQGVLATRMVRQLALFFDSEPSW